MLLLAGAAAACGVLSLFVAPKFFGPGFLLLSGSALTRLLDVHRERRDARTQAMEEHRRGLDETRRLLYMIWLSRDRPSAELVASATNALIHHHRRDYDDLELAHRLFECGQNAMDEEQEWMDGLIDDITKELNASR